MIEDEVRLDPISDAAGGADADLLLSAVSQAIRHVTRGVGLEETLAAIVQGVRRHLQLDRASIFLYDRQKGELVRLIAVDRAGEIQHGPGLPIHIADGDGAEQRWSWPMQQVVLGQAPFIHAGTRAIVPLVAHDEVLGTLGVDNLFSNTPIPERLIQPLCLLGQFAAVAISNALSHEEDRRLRATVARLSEELQAEQRVLLAAFEAAWEIAREQEPARMLAAVSEKVRLHLGVDNVGIYLYHPEHETLERLIPLRTAEADFLFWEGGAMRVGEEIALTDVEGALRAVVTGISPHAHLTNVVAPAPLAPSNATRVNRGGHAAVPLVFNGAIIGAMVVDNHLTGHDLSERLMKPLRFFGHFASVAVTNALRQQELLLAESQKKQFYRDIVYAVTNGKLHLCEREEIEGHWHSTTSEHTVEESLDIKSVRDAAHSLGRAAGMSQERVEDLGLCVSEAVTNALKHAGGGRVRLDNSGEMIHVRVDDAGHGIDPLQIPRATLMRGYSTRASLGLGFTLMHELADRIYLHTGPKGTIVIMEMAVEPMSKTDKMLALFDLTGD
jgi:anti-sigma regulatory factor (Ser/Thr protein kinase)/GAF domain-containing protein